MRDSAVDLVKAFCLLVVVGLHSLMAGVTMGPEGLNVTNALAGNQAFAWSTWIVQVMPLFFLLGGFASITHWRRMRDAGATPADYIRERVNRLARPALLPIALVGATIATLTLTGVSSEVLSRVGFNIGQPLWFLAVYLGCAAFVPFMTRLHEAAPKLTLFTLLAAALIVDTVSVTFDLAAVSALNFLFVWLFIQQLGFWYADGFFSVFPRWALLAIGIAAYGTLLVLTLGIGYSTDMYENLNPPTTCIVVLGIGQIFLVAFAHPWLSRLAALSRVQRAANTINANSMTIYLWHVPVVVIIALSMIGAALPMPEPLSVDWWQTRPLFLALVAVALAPLVYFLARRERRRRVQLLSHIPVPLAVAKAVFSVAGVATILLIGFTPVWSWALGLSLLALAVIIGARQVQHFAPEPTRTL